MSYSKGPDEHERRGGQRADRGARDVSLRGAPRELAQPSILSCLPLNGLADCEAVYVTVTIRAGLNQYPFSRLLLLLPFDFLPVGAQAVHSGLLVRLRI